MPDIRLIVMDMDGTLLQPQGRGFSHADVEALRTAHQSGIQLALCSGRVPDDMSFFALDTGLPMHILSLNGTCVLDKPLGKIAQNRFLPADTARELLRLVQQFPVTYGLFSQHDLLLHPSTFTRDDLRTIIGENIFREGSREKVCFDPACIEKLLQQGVNKMMVFTQDNPQSLIALRSRLEKEIPGIDISSSWVNNLEVNPQGWNKGAALQALANRLKIPMAQVMAIGDNENDVPMLRTAGVAVAMGNATSSALSAAHWKSLSNDQSGVSAAIRHLALGENRPGVIPLTRNS